MTTTIKRKPKSAVEAVDPKQTFAQHILLKREASTLTTRSNSLKDRLKKWFNDRASDEIYENEKGSLFFDFDETISDGKDEYRGMELRRSTTVKFDEEVAEQILARKAKKDPTILEDAQSAYIDQEKIYRLVQEGRITQAELDKMMPESESFAFWAIKGEVL